MSAHVPEWLGGGEQKGVLFATATIARKGFVDGDFRFGLDFVVAVVVLVLEFLAAVGAVFFLPAYGTETAANIHPSQQLFAEKSSQADSHGVLNLHHELKQLALVVEKVENPTGQLLMRLALKARLGGQNELQFFHQLRRSVQGAGGFLLKISFGVQEHPASAEGLQAVGQWQEVVGNLFDLRALGSASRF